MTGARMNTLAALRGDIERIETCGDLHAPRRVSLGHAEADAMLRGGLAVAAVHEVFAEGHQSAVATGFIAGLAGRVAPRRPLVWVRQDFSEMESGALSMSGLSELGLDPRCLVTVRAADGESALRTAADALACDALGAVVLEVWGEPRQLDLVASRKLTLAAQASGVTGLLLRIGPVDVEPPLDAVVQKCGRLRALRDVLGRHRQPFRSGTQQQNLHRPFASQAQSPQQILRPAHVIAHYARLARLYD